MAAREATVGIAHRKEQDLSDEDVLGMVRAAVDHVGGIRAFVRPGDLVVLKPNMTIWLLATDGVTTDPRVVASMVRLCKEAGAGHVVVGDGSGGDLKSKRVLDVTGVTRLAEDAGADEVVGFEDLDHEEVEVETSRGERHAVRVPRLLLEAQRVVNLPKAKTHFEDRVSCALKNWVGVIHQKQRPRFMVDPLLEQVTCALHKRLPATLTVVDGLWAGTGDGPGANEPAWLGCVAAGADPVAIDATVCRLLGMHPAELLFAAEGSRLGLGTRDDVRVVGASVEAVAIRATPTRLGYDHLPVRVLAGEGVTWAGSKGHFKSIADIFLKYGFWSKIEAAYGPPTFMIGAVEDPDFEAWVEKGPYFVIDDAALPKYKDDPRVTFIPGHPATHNIFPHLFKRLHVETLGPAALKFESVFKQAEAWFHFQGFAPGPPLEKSGQRRRS